MNNRVNTRNNLELEIIRNVWTRYQSILEFENGLLEKELLNFSAKNIPNIVFLLSSSRAGSSVTKGILSNQAKTANAKILGLPGEQRPYLMLSRTDFSNLKQVSDEFESTSVDKKILEYMLMSEIGYQIDKTDRLEAFSARVLSRIVIQYPEQDISLGNSLGKIYDCVKEVCSINRTPNEYHKHYSMQLLTKLSQKIGFDYRWYDNSSTKEIQTAHVMNPKLSRAKVFIEEAPFVIPEPWENATWKDIENGVLLLKDPSDCWHMGVWENLFNPDSIKTLCLYRRAEEVVNGIFDGWNSEYGFMTYRVQENISLEGYKLSDKRWLNFSTNRKIIDNIINGKYAHLLEIAYDQWFLAYQSIQLLSNKFETYTIGSRNAMGFDYIRLDAVNAINEISEWLNVSSSVSLIASAKALSKNRIMVTPGTKPKIDRWKLSPNADIIKEHCNKDKTYDINNFFSKYNGQ